MVLCHDTSAMPYFAGVLEGLKLSEVEGLWGFQLSQPFITHLYLASVGVLLCFPPFLSLVSCQFEVMVVICLWWGWRQACGFCNLIISEQLPVRFHRCTNAICLCLWKLHIGIICMAFYQCVESLYLCTERLCMCVGGGKGRMWQRRVHLLRLNCYNGHSCIRRCTAIDIVDFCAFLL